MDTPERTQVVVVLATAPSHEVAHNLVTTLVEESLLACGTISAQATSIYHWEGAVETALECQLLMKTSADRVTELQRRFTELHPYEVPEFLVLPVESGLETYLAWVHTSTHP